MNRPYNPPSVKNKQPAMNTSIVTNKDAVKQRVNEMREIGKVLKSEFSGIDREINQLIRHVTPFYATPELLTRPVVICLWGMTGVGKTHVLRRLANLMGMDSHYASFDMGEYAGSFSEYTLRYQLDDVADAVDNGRAMIVFDEMQTIRFINEQGSEVDRPAARLIWEILDGAPLTRNGSFTNPVLDMIKDFRRLITLSVTIKKNEVVDNLKQFKKMRRRWERDETAPKVTLAISESDFETLYGANPSRFEYNENYDYWEKQFKTMFMSIEDVLKFLEEVNAGYRFGEPKNLSRSLIFCVGNLDEVYQGSHEVSPDTDIETLREFTEKVTMSQVKTALLTRFRPEQIARLGNNHIIYPSLDRASYWSIIDKFIVGSVSRAKEFYNITLDVDDSVRQLIFKESVFPTQGARPVNNSFSILFDSYLAEAVCELPDKDGSVTWAYLPDERKYRFTRGQDKLEVDVQLLVESRRENEDTDQQALIGVHEAGHAICHGLYTGRWPRDIRSRTAGVAGGQVTFTPYEFKTRQDVIDMVKCNLGGLVAESIIFGTDNVSYGGLSDLDAATTSLKQAVALLGLFPECTTAVINENNTACLSDERRVEQVSDFVVALMNQCRADVVRDLTAHRDLILSVGQYLTKHVLLTGADFAVMAEEHGLKLTERFSHRKVLLDQIQQRQDKV